MGERVQGKPSLALCRVVSEQVCAQGMAELVDSDRRNDGEHETQEGDYGVGTGSERS